MFAVGKICGKSNVDKYFKNLVDFGAEGTTQEANLEYVLKSKVDGELDAAKLAEFNEACKHIVENLGTPIQSNRDSQKNYKRTDANTETETDRDRGRGRGRGRGRDRDRDRDIKV